MRVVLALLVVVGAGAACEDGNVEGPLNENLPPYAEPNAGCAKECHGREETNSPPLGLGGVTMTSAVGVGAHASHMQPAPDWHRRVECE